MYKSIHNESYRKCLKLLREKRIERGITQGLLADKLGVSQGIVSKIETCERRMDIIELKTICDAMGISFVGFVMEVDKIL